MKKITQILILAFFSMPFIYSCQRDECICPAPPGPQDSVNCDSVKCWARFYWYGTLTETPAGGFIMTGFHRDTTYSTLLCDASDSTKNKELLLKPFAEAQGLEKRFHEIYNKVWYVNGEVTKWGFIECGCY